MEISLGPWLLDHRIANGGMGEVWAGRHSTEGVAVAIKLLLDAHPPAARELVHAEARAVAGLDHPGIALVFDYDEVGEATAARSLVP